MESTEEDTFNRLKRVSFRDMNELWSDARAKGGLTEEQCQQIGWTRKECMEERYRKWRDGEL